MNMERQSNNNPVIFNRGDQYLEQWENRGYIQEIEDDPMDMDSTPPKPAQGLPPRCSSEPIRHNNLVESQVDELLQDWPRRRMSSSECSVNTQDWHSLYKQLKPRVTFSERSSMHVYHPDPHYAHSKSYSRQERKSFGSEALSEAIRIKKLVVYSTPSDGQHHASTKDSFKYLLKNNIISLEEIVGIEHLVLGNSVSKLLRERKEHARAVLMEQHRMAEKIRQQEQEQSMKKLNDPYAKLGEFSASRSVKSVKRARIRAAMAAWRD